MASNGFVPLYQIIYDELKAKIQSRFYAAGSKLPFERELCDSYGVQRITVRKALDMLVQEGLITKSPGVGSFVSEEPTENVEAIKSGSLLFVMNKSKNDILSNSSAYNARLFFLMEQLCREKGYTLLYIGVSTGSEIHALAEQHHIVGAFLVSSLLPEITDTFLQMDFPVLCLNHYDPRFMSVLPDNQRGIGAAVRHLTALGHRRIAFVGGAPDAFNAEERLRSFLFAASESGLPPQPELILRGDWTYDGSLQAVWEMFKRLPRDRWPTALVAASDMMAIGAMEAASRVELKIPRDLSVVGFDNIDLCRFCSPQLTSAGPDVLQMAEVAVEHMLTLQLRSPSPYDRYVVRLPVNFIERSSVAAPTS